MRRHPGRVGTTATGLRNQLVHSLARRLRSVWVPLSILASCAGVLLNSIPAAAIGASPALAVAAGLPTHPDTLRLTVEQAIQRFLAESPSVAAADFRERGAEAALRQAEAYANPQLSVLAENVGAEEATSGQAGLRGVHGTVLISVPLHWGGLRGRTMDLAAAELEVEAARSSRERITGAVEFSRLVVALELAQARLISGQGETAALAEWVRGLDQRVQEGHAAAGEAARARVEWAQASTRKAQAQGDRDQYAALLAIALGLEPDEAVAIQLLPACSLPTANSQADGVVVQNGGPLDALQAGVRAGQSAESLAQARQIPSILPQLGWRREAGVNALTLGFGVELPLLNRQRASVEEARQMARAAERDLESARLKQRAVLHGQELRIEGLERAGQNFDGQWQSALALTVTSSEAAYREGEATLEDVLQARRARMNALESLSAWQSALRNARLTLSELEGRLPGASTFCAQAPFEGEE